MKEQVAELHSAGLTVREIAEEMGRRGWSVKSAITTIHHYLSRMNLKPNPEIVQKVNS